MRNHDTFPEEDVPLDNFIESGSKTSGRHAARSRSCPHATHTTCVNYAFHLVDCCTGRSRISQQL
eukprot:6431968-Karenia_brevis.AAC.1